MTSRRAVLVLPGAARRRVSAGHPNQQWRAALLTLFGIEEAPGRLATSRAAGERSAPIPTSSELRRPIGRSATSRSRPSLRPTRAWAGRRRGAGEPGTGAGAIGSRTSANSCASGRPPTRAGGRGRAAPGPRRRRMRRYRRAAAAASRTGAGSPRLQPDAGPAISPAAPPDVAPPRSRSARRHPRSSCHPPRSSRASGRQAAAGPETRRQATAAVPTSLRRAGQPGAEAEPLAQLRHRPGRARRPRGGRRPGGARRRGRAARGRPGARPGTRQPARRWVATPLEPLPPGGQELTRPRAREDGRRSVGADGGGRPAGAAP